MKIKHNKKRNTAFLFETLILELTKSIVDQNPSRGKKIKGILSEHFRKGMVLFAELDCFKSLTDNETPVDHYTAEKLVHHARRAYDDLDRDEIFAEQSQVINRVNKELGKETFNNFVPNYKSYATLSQIFGKHISVKNRVLMERKIIHNLTQDKSVEEKIEPVDNLVVDSFVERFNKKYQDLLPEQAELLQKFVSTPNIQSVEFRMHLAEELKRIHRSVKESLASPEVTEDPEMTSNTKQVIELIEGMNVSKMDEKQIIKVLKLQKLVREYQEDANKN